MATVSVKVCDKCGERSRPTTSFSIESGPRRATVDLCDEHGTPLTGFLDQFNVAKRPASRVRITPKYQEYLGTIDDVEQSKTA